MPGEELCDAAGLDEDCDALRNEGCMELGVGPTRLDTGVGAVTDSAVGEHSTFHVTAAAAGDTYFVAYADTRDEAGGAPFAQPRLFGRVSLDAGVNWVANEMEIPGPGTSDRVEPNAFMHSARIYLAYAEYVSQASSGRVRRIYVTSADQPAFDTWSTPGRLDDVPSNDSGIDLYRPQGVVARADAANPDNDLLAVVWSEVDASILDDDTYVPTHNIYLSYSQNGGQTWSPQQHINSDPDPDFAELPAIATDGNGMVYVAWRDQSSGNGRVWLRRIDVAAGTVNAAIPVEPAPTGEEDGSVGDVAIAADTLGNVHVVWTDVNEFAMRVATGTTCGVSATNATCEASLDYGGEVINPVGQILSAAAANPSVAARDGQVVVAWEDQRSGPIDIRVNRASNTDGWTWLYPAQWADADGLGNAESADPHIAFGEDGRVVVAWLDLRDNPERASVYANVSLDGGTTFYDGPDAYALHIDAPLANADSLTPFVLANPDNTGTGRATVVWLDYFDGSGNGINGDVYAQQLGASGG
jgi:hypothetical protein